MPTVEHEDYQYAIPSRSSIESEYTGDFISHEGYVTTDYGYVLVWSRLWGDANTRLEFIHAVPPVARLHVRYIDNVYQPRYLVTSSAAVRK